ncbi:MAG: hypothetical protein K2X90_01270 [Candidatus Babeliaceae bacterium]|nr:hypothetical protein [Candidatus Babeliaceae bacterium]
MKNKFIFFTFLFFISTVNAGSLGFDCAKRFNELKANMTPGFNAIADYIKEPAGARRPLELVFPNNDNSLKNVYQARLKAVQSFYQLVKIKKKAGCQTTLSELVHEFAQQNNTGARYLLEDAQGFALAAVQLAISEIGGV